jgi:hypothetical protein
MDDPGASRVQILALIYFRLLFHIAWPVVLQDPIKLRREVS